MVSAAGSGDDTVVGPGGADAAAERRRLVVTADRELRGAGDRAGRRGVRPALAGLPARRPRVTESKFSHRLDSQRSGAPGTVPGGTKWEQAGVSRDTDSGQQILFGGPLIG